jgi:nitroreductase
MDLASAIAKRRSVRRYSEKAVPKQLVQQTIAAGQNAARLCPEIDVRWYTVWNGSTLYRCLEDQATVYGVFTVPPHYVIAVSEERPGYMENLGFCMEQMILAATSLGLGTCWIGGMFSEASLSEFAPDLGRNERIVALTPLGYADTSPRADMARRLHRWGTDRLGKRKPLSEIVSQYIWTVPWTDQDETLNRILEQTRFAPSWANTQPWHFVLDDQQVIATVDHTPQAGNVREGKPYYRLDGGIAMCHFYLAAQAEGWTGQWRVPEEAERKMLRDRYAIPGDYDVLGVLAIK